MGEARYILGMEIIRNCPKRHLGMSLEAYIKKVSEQFSMHYFKPINTPVKKGLILSLYQFPKTDKEKAVMSNVPYASTIGSLTYAML